MLRDGLARVLVVDADAAQRRTIVSALTEAGLHVAEIADTTNAITVAHQSPYPLVVIVSAACSQVLCLAAADRRLVHHHAYILLQPDDKAPAQEWMWPHTYLKLWTLPAPLDTQALLTAVAQAERALGIVPVG